MKLTFQYAKHLAEFVQTVDQSLTASPMHHWQYAGEKWNTEVIRQENLAIIDETANKAGVYAIFVNDKLVYIGQVQGQGSKAHFHAHFISKDPRTGSKLELVKIAVAAKMKIGFSFIEIDPAELRHLIEEKLIKTHSPEWNSKSLTMPRPERKPKAATKPSSERSTKGATKPSPEWNTMDATMPSPEWNPRRATKPGTERSSRRSATPNPDWNARGTTTPSPEWSLKSAPKHKSDWNAMNAPKGARPKNAKRK